MKKTSGSAPKKFISPKIQRQKNNPLKALATSNSHSHQKNNSPLTNTLENMHQHPLRRGNCKTTMPQNIDHFDASFQGQQAGPCRADETMPGWAGEEARRELAPKGRYYGAQELSNCLLKVENLKKSYSGKVVVDGLSFDVKPGEVVGLLGPN